MGVGGSLVVFAVGAILRYATTATVSGLNLQTVGVILMVVGAIGFVMSLFFWGSWGGFGSVGGSRYRTRTVVTEQPQAYADPRYVAPVTTTRGVITRTDEESVA
jgi:hypothetical protein